MVHPSRSGPTDIYEEVLQQKARCNIVLGSKNEMIQVPKSILKEKHYCQIFYSNKKFNHLIIAFSLFKNVLIIHKTVQEIVKVILIS